MTLDAEPVYDPHGERCPYPWDVIAVLDADVEARRSRPQRDVGIEAAARILGCCSRRLRRQLDARGLATPQHPIGWWEALLACEEPRRRGPKPGGPRGATRRATIAILREESPLSTADVRARLYALYAIDLERNRVARNLSNLARAGRIRHVERGLWATVET